MKRLWRIFILQFQEALESRSRSFVWFLIAMINPLLQMIFIQETIKTGMGHLEGWNSTSVVMYYFMLMIANALLVVHIEEKIAQHDIHEGRLSIFLLKPFSYLLFNLVEELPYRLIQGFFGLVIFSLVLYFSRSFISLTFGLNQIVYAILITILAFVISFTFKVIVGLTASWFTDYRGFQQMVNVTLIVFAGIILPLGLYPKFLLLIANFLPFSYIIYYPIMSWMGQMDSFLIFRIIMAQIFWIVLLFLTYRVMWKKGKQKFSAIGN